MRNLPIFIVDTDAAKLRGLLAARFADRQGRDQEHLEDLASELERAFVVDAGAVPSGVVMLDSEVRVADLLSGERRDLTVVFPSEADPPAGRISVLAPLGCALMGSRQGEVVEWEMPGGLRRLRIDKVTARGTDGSRRKPGTRRTRAATFNLQEGTA
jgi:regulator of nucleoside diphosphate kinase